MVFSTAAFLYVFLPVFLLCYTFLPWKNAVALLFSLLFFSWGEGSYLLLLVLVIAFNYGFGRGIAALGSGNTRRRVLSAGVALNLLVLGYYKYFSLLTTDLLPLGPPVQGPSHLPLGISFFIFQSISYLVDVARRDAQPARSIFDLALYIAMFPQLIAGPIVRYEHVAAALAARQVTTEDVWRGLQLFALGLGYKILLANNCAEVADVVFGADATLLARSTAWLGVVAYTLQIFFDFAGYSLMAIGLGRLMGFRFPRNFNYPYVSRSVTEFWQRWHMSLSSWFRDYLYIPLGGNRQGPWRTYRNLLLVFFLCGLWHGAAWTFVVWGMFHGALLVIERVGLGRVLSKLPWFMAWAYTLLAVMLGWVLFRAESFTHAADYLLVLFLGSAAQHALAPAVVLTHENLAYLLVGCLMCLPWLEVTRWRSWDDDRSTALVWTHRKRLADALMIVLVLTVCSVYVMSGTYNPFIYFRF